MTLEGGGDRPLNPNIKKIIDSGFSGGRKLYGDSFNIWMVIFEKTKPAQIQALSPLPHYKQHYDEETTSDGQKFNQPEEVAYMMELSDPVAVAAFDQLVDEFNADLERIKQNNDAAAVQNFYERARTLIYKKG